MYFSIFFLFIRFEELDWIDSKKMFKKNLFLFKLLLIKMI